MAQRHGVALRQSYARVGKFARHAHAKLFKRASRKLKTLRTYLGYVIRHHPRRQGIPRPQCAARHKFSVFISGQKRGVTPKIQRELRRRAAVKPVIGHLKAEHRMGRNYLWLRQGDAANAVLAAAGYNSAASSVG